MSKKIFLSDIDLALNQLLQAKLENLPTDPANTESRFYYNTVSKKVKFFNGTAWVSVVDDTDSRLTNPRTPTAHVIATNTGLGSEHTISGAAPGQVLRASGPNAANFQQLAHSDLLNAGANTHAQIDTHIGDATKHRVINDTGTSNTDLFSASKILQLIADINTTVAGSLVFKGNYDAATNTPLLDATPIAVTQGWTYVVTAPGLFFTEQVEIGDMIIAKQTNPTTLAHWTVVNKNIPDVILSLLTGFVKGAGVISATDSVLTAIQKLDGNMDLKAPLASPAFTGTATAQTPALGDNSTRLATTAFVNSISAGLLTKSVAGGANVTLTADEAANGIIILTGAITANIQVIIPAVGNRLIVANRTTGAFTVTVKTAAGTGIVVAQNTNETLFCDGTNVLSAQTDFTDVVLQGNPTTSTQAASDNSTRIATTAFVKSLGYTTSTGTVRKYAALLVTDGSATAVTIAAATHGLGTSGDFMVQLREVATGMFVDTEVVTNATTGAVVINFNVAPAAGVYRIIILG